MTRYSRENAEGAGGGDHDTARPQPAKPVAPKPVPDPKTEAKDQTPKHVLALWTRLLAECGDDKAKCQAELAKAATGIWGAEVPPKHAWTEADCAELLRVATDVSF